MAHVVNLDKSNRFAEIDLKPGVKKIHFNVSRKDCRDVLVEFVDTDGNAKSKPLSKCLEVVKIKNLAKIRFIMNNMSSKPMLIEFD